MIGTRSVILLVGMEIIPNMYASFNANFMLADCRQVKSLLYGAESQRSNFA